MAEVPEQSTAWLTVTFKNRSGLLEAPSSFRYRIDTNEGIEVKDWETISNPSASYEITLTPSDNSITGSNQIVQKNIVTVNATFGAGDERNQKFDYNVRNLSKIT